MGAFQERIKGLRELPTLKFQMDEQKLKLMSLEKIKNSVSNENYLTLSSSYEKTINELTQRIDQLQTGILLIKNDIELDSKMLESEFSLLEKELQELQFLSERGALSKQDFDTKRNTLQQKINKNKSNLSKNQSAYKELDFYATYVGTDNYLKHNINETTGSIKLKFTSIKPKVWITLGVSVVLILAALFLFKPVKSLIVEKLTWNKAVKESTYESFGKFMTQYPNSKEFNTAKIKQEEAKWTYTKKGNTLVQFDNYISVYPNGKYSNEANIFRDSLMWVDIIKKDNLTAYTNYLSLFPNGKYVNQALTKITEISASNSCTDNRDGEVYKTVVIGNQIWMAENLNATLYNDGSLIPNITNNIDWSNLSTGAYCWINNDPVKNKELYGALYNWYAIDNDKLCPFGWHVPTIDEWKTLTTFLGGQNVAGGKLKETGFAHWLQPNDPKIYPTNESGFSALPGSFRSDYGHFIDENTDGTIGVWWSSTTVSTTKAMHIVLTYDSNSIGGLLNGETNKKSGHFVRCLKD